MQYIWVFLLLIYIIFIVENLWIWLKAVFLCLLYFANKFSLAKTSTNGDTFLKISLRARAMKLIQFITSPFQTKNFLKSIPIFSFFLLFVYIK